MALTLPEQTSHRYAPVGRCIYCGAAEGLTDEHIIPYGLGGRLILPASSCRDCARITGAYEGVCLRTMLGNLRMQFDLPSRRKKDRPARLPLQVKHTTDQAEWSIIEVDQREYPFLILFPYLPLPDAISGEITSGERGAKVQRLWVRGAAFEHGIFAHMDQLAAKLGVAMINPTATFSAPEFFVMLAKIAHSYAVAKLGPDGFAPFLRPVIKDGDTSNVVEWIGGRDENEPRSAALHEVALAHIANGPPGLVCVRIRLLACLDTPTYFVAVGMKIAQSE